MPSLDILTNRRSIRSFTGEHVPDADLDAIIGATQQAATSSNGQQVSLVVVRDRERIERLAALTGGQRQVACADAVVVFCIDFHRTAYAGALHGYEHVLERSAEGILVGAVDAGISLATFQTAAHAMGYGTTAIGGIRRDAAGVIELLGVPERVFPVVASTIGVPDRTTDPGVKPRVPRESFAMAETYDPDAVDRGVEAYDQLLHEWYVEQGRPDWPSYSESIGSLYSGVYYQGVADALQSQGVGLADQV